ncbi:hypothetical protein Acr_09g0003410 [Actinidia rufa]|uniref:CCHC-type domain-containing protein n=1 Tax=Actinidia rufa TaxID=165716 RepID=A0A7J0F5B2_9ERIC|nr:hypothetical protein Acr_09g0003410 [Actinidia rufa]
MPPPSCEKCKTFGHLVKNCPLVPHVPVSVEQEQPSPGGSLVEVIEDNGVKAGDLGDQGVVSMPPTMNKKGLAETIEVEAVKIVTAVNTQNKMDDEAARRKRDGDFKVYVRSSFMLCVPVTLSTYLWFLHACAAGTPNLYFAVTGDKVLNDPVKQKEVRKLIFEEAIKVIVVIEILGDIGRFRDVLKGRVGALSCSRDVAAFAG